MQKNDPLFIGVVPTARVGATTFAVLNPDLELLLLTTDSLEELIAVLAEATDYVVAICGPQHPNSGLMTNESFRQTLTPNPRPGSWENTRLAEYQLYQHKINIPKTRHQAQDCPTWMQTSFNLFDQLKKTGCVAYPQPEEARQYMEVNAFAAFAVLLGTRPFTKSSLEGRLQRQLILSDLGLDIPDAMRVFEEITRFRLMQGILDLDGLYTHPELDALVAAYTAWKAIRQARKITLLGDPDEGQIVLPAVGLKKAYR
jgi:hypothetical protein